MVTDSWVHQKENPDYKGFDAIEIKTGKRNYMKARKISVFFVLNGVQDTQLHMSINYMQGSKGTQHGHLISTALQKIQMVSCLK